MRLLVLTTIALIPSAFGGSPFMHRQRTIARTVSSNITAEEPVLANPYLAPGGKEALGTKQVSDFITSQGKNVFDVVYQWNIIDFLYPSLKARNDAIRTKYDFFFVIVYLFKLMSLKISDNSSRRTTSRWALTVSAIASSSPHLAGTQVYRLPCLTSRYQSKTQAYL